MQTDLRTSWFGFALALQASGLILGWHLRGDHVGALLFAAVALLSAINWRAAYIRRRLILDTPTSKIASAALGYVELHGQAAQIPGQQTLSRLTGLPCLWYRYSVEQRREQRWARIDRGRSDAPFLLRDDSGSCLVDPEHADVLLPRKDQWTKGEYRFTEELILDKDSLYVLGELHSTGTGSTASASAKLTRLLTQWKRDQPGLLARFDDDRSGHLDTQEWETAVTAARHELQFQPDSPPTYRNLVRKPGDARPFLLSHRPPEALTRRYTNWIWINTLGFILAIIGLAFYLHAQGVQ